MMDKQSRDRKKKLMKTQMEGRQKTFSGPDKMLSTSCVYVPGGQRMETRASEAQHILGAKLRLHIFANTP